MKLKIWKLENGLDDGNTYYFLSGDVIVTVFQVNLFSDLLKSCGVKCLFSFGPKRAIITTDEKSLMLLALKHDVIWSPNTLAVLAKDSDYLYWLRPLHFKHDAARLPDYTLTITDEGKAFYAAKDSNNVVS